MIEWIKTLIIRAELNKIEVSSEALFYDILCNKYNKRNSFDRVENYCCLAKGILQRKTIIIIKYKHNESNRKNYKST